MAAVAQLEPGFTALLQRQRQAFNALFFQARNYAHQLGPEAVYAFLEQTLQPVVMAVEPYLDKESLDRLALELTVLALDLLGKQLLNPAGPFALIEAGWRRLFCRFPSLLAAAPRPAIAAVSNALVQLCLHPGAKPEAWLDGLERLGGHCPDLAAFLQLGQVLSWRCGLAHYRAGALELLPRLPEAVQQALLGGLPLTAWLASPWCKQSLNGSGLSIVHATGSFAGWGGKLFEPPRMTWSGDALLVADSQACWYLFADAFGESWHQRGEDPELGLAMQPREMGPWRIDGDGTVSLGPLTRRFPQLANWRHASGTSHTLAVSQHHSFRIYLVAQIQA
ncbi:MAG: hypothetical protein ACAI44_12670 [Candidatus Sericytochromatia bacterium]